jgi:hypothetical protein
MPFIAAAYMLSSAHAAGAPLFVVKHVTGTDPDGQPNTAIYDHRDGATDRPIVSPRPSEEPKENLTGFSHLSLSPDGRVLYFQARAWATSDAVHAVDLVTRKVSFVTDGEIACVLKVGKWRGDLVVDQHRYYPQGGSHDDLWLYEPSGRQVSLVMEGEDAAGVCGELEKQ